MIKFHTKIFFLFLLCNMVACGVRNKVVVEEKSSFQDTLDKIKEEILHPKSEPLDSIKSYHIGIAQPDCKGFADSVWQMKNLQSLSMNGKDCNEHCGGVTISPKIGQLTQLEELNIQLVGISFLPDEIKNCKKLKKINFTDSSIENIDNLTSLENLEELWLFGCNLEKLPADIGRLKKLKYLGLTGNWQLTDDEIKRVKQALPKCEISFER